jgi:stearoyl-CoA desaturase (delta-9 desaturase)
MYWRIEHLHHHATSDTTQDIHSPINGRANSFLLWSFNVNRINAVFKNKKSVRSLKQVKQDKHIMYASDYFVFINIIFLVLLFFIDINLFFAWNVGYLLEHIKIGIINWILHEPRFPGNYRNHDTTDQSFNNVFLGLITFGFGWHNNHHANCKKLILTEHWWEVDLEGQIGKMIAWMCPQRN